MIMAAFCPQLFIASQAIAREPLLAIVSSSHLYTENHEERKGTCNDIHPGITAIAHIICLPIPS